MKSILVIDTPPNCMDCPIATMIKDKVRNKYEAYCTPCGKFNEQTMEKPEWCPLKPMPEKKPVSYHDDLFGDIEKNYTNIGWNACLEEIEK